MELKCEYHQYLEFKYLKPTKKLTKLAYKELTKLYKKSINGERSIYDSRTTFYFNYFKIRKREVIRYEFAYYVRAGKNRQIYNEEGNQFTFMGAHNFARRHGIQNEKRCFSYMGGYTYKSTYDDYVYSYTTEKKTFNAFRYMGSRIFDESYKKVKINDYLTIDGRKFQDFFLQKCLNDDPELFEMIWKFGFMKLLTRKIAKNKIEFLKRNIKIIPKDIEKKELDLMYKIEKMGESIEDSKEISRAMSTLTYSFRGYNYILYGRENYRRNIPYDVHIIKHSNLKTYYRIRNILKENKEITIKDITHFAGACFAFELDFDKEIFKGKKVREGIVEAFEREKEIEKEQEFKKKEESFKEIERKKRMTLPEITSHYKELNINDYLMKPIKSMREFREIQDNMKLCLMDQRYYEKVLLEKSILYVVIKKGKTDKDRVVVEWRLEEKNKMIVNQINGFDNKTDEEDYKAIKKIAKKINYKTIYQERGQENGI